MAVREVFLVIGWIGHFLGLLLKVRKASLDVEFPSGDCSYLPVDDPAAHRPFPVLLECTVSELVLGKIGDLPSRDRSFAELGPSIDRTAWRVGKSEGKARKSNGSRGLVIPVAYGGAVKSVLTQVRKKRAVVWS